MQNLDFNKARSYDNISICILKVFGNSIHKSLEIIFRQTLLTGVFLPEWNKGNIVLVYKKVDKQNI